jgi:hypothetical protein
VADDPTPQLQRLEIALGLLAPAGTAPCDALHDLWVVCRDGGDPRKALSALQQMVRPAWPDWDAYNNPPELPDPAEPAAYASGLSMLEGLRRFAAVTD